MAQVFDKDPEISRLQNTIDGLERRLAIKNVEHQVRLYGAHAII